VEMAAFGGLDKDSGLPIALLRVFRHAEVQGCAGGLGGHSTPARGSPFPVLCISSADNHLPRVLIPRSQSPCSSAFPGGSWEEGVLQPTSSSSHGCVPHPQGPCRWWGGSWGCPFPSINLGGPRGAEAWVWRLPGPLPPSH
jgi:hypothetical protein